MNRAILILLMLFTTVSFAQRGNREKIKSLKVAFITEKLDLSSKEAQQFWPVYNRFEEERELLRKKERVEIREKINDMSALSETEAKNLFEKFKAFKTDERKLEQAYITEMEKVLSAKKILLLFNSEEDFKRELLKRYRQNRGGR